MKKNNSKTPVLTLIIIFAAFVYSGSLIDNLNFLKINFVQLSNQITQKDPYKYSKIDTARKVKYLNNLEKDVILELNKVRTNPPLYAKTQLVQLRSYYKGDVIKYPNRLQIKTQEGVKAVDECIAVLSKTKPIGALSPSEGLSKAARDMVKDQSPTSNVGHTGRDGSSPFDRMNRYGKWLSTAGENIDYGYNQADLIVLSLLVDDGVADRGHRTNILNKNFKVVGVASGTHKLYRNMFMMDFAGGYQEK